MSQADYIADELRTLSDEAVEAFLFMYAEGVKRTEDLDLSNEKHLKFVEERPAYARDHAEVLLNI